MAKPREIAFLVYTLTRSNTLDQNLKMMSTLVSTERCLYKKVSLLHVVLDLVLYYMYTEPSAILVQYGFNIYSCSVLLLTLEVLECQMHPRLY